MSKYWSVIVRKDNTSKSNIYAELFEHRKKTLQLAIELQKELFDQYTKQGQKDSDDWKRITEGEPKYRTTKFVKIYNSFINEINKFAKGEINRIAPYIVRELCCNIGRGDDKLGCFTQNYYKEIKNESMIWDALPANNPRQAAYIGLSIGVASSIIAFTAGLLCLILISNSLLSVALYLSLSLGLTCILLLATAAFGELFCKENKDLTLDGKPKYCGEDNWDDIKPIQIQQHTNINSLFRTSTFETNKTNGEGRTFFAISSAEL